MSYSCMKYFIGKPLTDLVLVGSMEVEPNHVNPSINHEYLYVKINGRLFLFSSINQMSELCVVETNAIDYNYDIDEDDRYFSISIRDLILLDTVSDINVQSVYEYTLDGSLKAIELILENGQLLFIDPTYYTGIKIGGDMVRKAFIDNHEGLQKAAR